MRWRPSVGELWHILAVGLPLDFPPPSKSETGPQLARRAREAGAFVAIAHPAWSQLTEDDGRALDAAHAVEIYNHGCAVETDRGDGFYLLDRLCNLGRRLTAIATDDAHFNHGERDAFGGFVEVKAESLEPEALLAALKAGHFYASQGPRLHDVRVGRDEIVVETSPVERGGAADRHVARAACLRQPYRPRRLRPRRRGEESLDRNRPRRLDSRSSRSTPPAAAPGPIRSGSTRSAEASSLRRRPRAHKSGP